MRQSAAGSSAWMAAADATLPKTVLIVEDNALNMKLFADLLEAGGYAVLRAAEGVAAFTLAGMHRPDLILMDIQLPGVSGLEVAGWLKADADLAHIPIIAVTAYAMKGDEQRILQGGCEVYLAKPVAVASFMKTARRYLEQASVSAKII